MTLVDTTTDAYEKLAEEGAMIALLPIASDWSRVEKPHLTLVYAGKVDDLAPTAFNDLAKDAAMLAALATGPMSLKTMGIDQFGDGVEKVDVLRMQPSTELWAMRRAVERWDASEHPFRPHVTIGPSNGVFPQYTPSMVAFDRICVGWGNELLPFWIKNGSRY